MRRRLFWKIYLTILASLIVVALVIAGVWRASGIGLATRWEQNRLRFAEALIPAVDDPPGTVQIAVDRLGRALGGDITVFARDGRIIARSGDRIALHDDEDDERPRDRRHKMRPMRVDLSDGRRVLARFDLPGPETGGRILLAVLLAAGGVGVAAFPVAALITRRIERLRSGVERWGSGQLGERVLVDGRDEVADLARAFNAAAARVEALMAAQKALLANASHELRSPLARLRMGVELMVESPDAAKREAVERDLAEVDALVEEILLASRLDRPDDARAAAPPVAIDLLGLAAEEASRVEAEVLGEAVDILGDATLIRRLVRNLLENARKHGKPPIEIEVAATRAGARIVVRDRGAGVPESERDRVFEAFYRPSGRGESAGGWGLGLALVRQIARRHGGEARCEAREGGGTVFTVDLAADGLRASRG
ncbi:MAG: sensor histidine kinase [Labrys sp. (in: a-proteobacteria)]